VQKSASQRLEKISSGYLLPLSARSPVALRALVQSYRTFLLSEPAQNSSLLDICFTASVCRSHHHYRLAVMGHTHTEIAERLDTFLQGSPYSVEDSSNSLHSLGKSYCLGNLIEWKQLYPQGRCVPSPTYPWQRQRHWFSAIGESLIPSEIDLVEQSLGAEATQRLTRASLWVLPEGDRRSKLESYFQQRVSRVLGMGSSKLSIHEPLQNIGLDSLMVVELKHRIEADLNLTLSMTEFLQDLNIAQLASRVLTQLTPPLPSQDVGWEEGVL
jgi:acyl transferase domain-containing protein